MSSLQTRTHVQPCCSYHLRIYFQQRSDVGKQNRVTLHHEHSGVGDPTNTGRRAPRVGGAPRLHLSRAVGSFPPRLLLSREQVM